MVVAGLAFYAITLLLDMCELTGFKVRTINVYWNFSFRPVKPWSLFFSHMNKLQKKPVDQKENWLQFVALQFIHLVRCVHFYLFVNTSCLQWSKCFLESTHVKNLSLQMAIFSYFWRFYSLLCLSPLPKTSISSAIHQVKTIKLMLTSSWRHYDIIMTSLWRHFDVTMTLVKHKLIFLFRICHVLYDFLYCSDCIAISWNSLSIRTINARFVLAVYDGRCSWNMSTMELYKRNLSHR